jgi:ssDNA-binding Zn-finger/Zn-ribbon topoisomerase 1
MKYKLIDVKNEILIECDNPNCDYNIPNETKKFDEDISSYVNAPCPKCGENLLTERDYRDSVSLVKKINWINKWFGWLGYFLNSKENGKNEKNYHVKVHNGIHVIKNDE